MSKICSKILQRQKERGVRQQNASSAAAEGRAQGRPPYLERLTIGKLERQSFLQRLWPPAMWLGILVPPSRLTLTYSADELSFLT